MSEQNNNAENETALDDKLDQAFNDLEKVQNEKAADSNDFAGVLAILLALVAIGIASYPAYNLYKNTNSEDAELLLVQNAVRRVADSQATTEQQLSQLSLSLQAQREGLESSVQSISSLAVNLDAELERIKGQVGTSSEDWLFAEIEYLVRMANQRVLMERDITSAIKLLESADRIVRDSEGLTGHQLRLALASDIAALKAVHVADVQGIYLSLSALVSQVPELRRPEYAYVQAPAVSETTAQPVSFLQKLRRMLSSGISRFTNLVDFRRGTPEIKPILPPKEDYYLRQNLILKLQIAQLALLDENESIFHASIAEAQTWVDESFDVNDGGSAAMRDALIKLGATQVASQMPDISGSLQAARAQLYGFDQESVQ